MLNFSILFLSTVTAGTPDSDSQLYRRIPEDSFSSSGSNDRMLTTFVGKRGDLVSDIRIGKRSRQDADCYKGGMGFDHDYYRTTVGTLDRWSRTSVEMGCNSVCCRCCRKCLQRAKERDWPAITHIALYRNCHCYHGSYNETCQGGTFCPHHNIGVGGGSWGDSFTVKRTMGVWNLKKILLRLLVCVICPLNKRRMNWSSEGQKQVVAECSLLQQLDRPRSHLTILWNIFRNTLSLTLKLEINNFPMMKNNLLF